MEQLAGDNDMWKKEDEGTVTTLAESLDEISCCRPSTCKEFSIVVNGTRYTGIESATNNSLCGKDNISCEKSEFEVETMKDRNNRLLTQEHVSLRRKMFGKSRQSGKHKRHSPRLMAIKEEASCNGKACCMSQAETSSAAILSEQEEVIGDVRSCETERMLKKRTIRCRHATRVESRTKTKKSISLVKRTTVVG